MKYAPHYRPVVAEHRVTSCEQTGTFTENPNDAEAAGKADGRPYVIADESGHIPIGAPDTAAKGTAKPVTAKPVAPAPPKAKIRTGVSRVPTAERGANV